MTKTPGLLPQSCRDELARAMLIPDRNQRLDAIDKARERAAYNNPSLFKETSSMQVKLKNVRLAFGDGLWEAKTVQGEGKPAFSCSFLLTPDHPQLEEIRDAMKAVAKEKWGAKAQEVYGLLSKQDRLALHDGDNKANYDGYPGNFFISARNAARPTVVNKDRSALTQSDGVVYSGCYVNAIVDFWAMDNKYGKRLCCSLSGVQFYADGDSFSGATMATADDFDDLGADAGASGAKADAW